MSATPESLRYTASHEWVRDLGDGVVAVGISDHAQTQLGDVVFIELPELGRQVAQGEAVAVVESVKAASDIYSPLAGTVLACNEALADAPERLNEDPYDAGWLFQLRLEDPSVINDLLSADQYNAQL